MKLNLRKKDRDTFNDDENSRGAFSDFDNKRPNRGSVFDTFIVILLVLAALLSYLYFNRNSGTDSQKEVSVVYNVQVNNVLSEIKDCAKVGDLLRDGVTNSMIGKISYVEVFPYTDLVPDYGTNTYTLATIPNRYSVRLTVKATGVTSGGMMSIDGKSIAIGTYIPIQSANFSGEGYCVDLTVDS